MTDTSAESVNRPDEPWKYPYVAAAVDFGANLNISVTSVDDAAVGYRIAPMLFISNTDRAVLGFLDDFCENHDLYPRLRETDTSYRLEISRRADLKTFLQLVRPYLIARERPVGLILDELIPGLEAGKHSTRAGFLDLIETVDAIRAETHGTGRQKYTAEYFRAEWDLPE